MTRFELGCLATSSYNEVPVWADVNRYEFASYLKEGQVVIVLDSGYSDHDHLFFKVISPEGRIGWIRDSYLRRL